jgi:hypothetical protein
MPISLRPFVGIVAGVVLAWAVSVPANAEDYASWPVLTSTFPSTGGDGTIIKGYDPVITGNKCITTFMAVPPGPSGGVYPNYIEFEAVSEQGGTLCKNGKWRSFDGNASGTTPFRVFFKDGVFYAGR